MKKRSFPILWFGLLTTGVILLATIDSNTEDPPQYPRSPTSSIHPLGKAAFSIPESSGNDRPIIKEHLRMTSMDRKTVKRAYRICGIVFKERRLPLGNEIPVKTGGRVTMEQKLNNQIEF